MNGVDKSGIRSTISEKGMMRRHMGDEGRNSRRKGKQNPNEGKRGKKWITIVGFALWEQEHLARMGQLLVSNKARHSGL
jgi:hypothetical protein